MSEDHVDMLTCWFNETEDESQTAIKPSQSANSSQRQTWVMRQKKTLRVKENMLKSTIRKTKENQKEKTQFLKENKKKTQEISFFNLWFKFFISF